jgi:acyl-CoA reductase-like NAD-dependent aldehyde dehydrogenase
VSCSPLLHETTSPALKQLRAKDRSATIGPIVPILSWRTEDEVIARANNTKMGLGASVWSGNIENAERIARKLEAGTVWVNTHFDLSPTQPFGGVKESGMGVEWGLQGMKSYCNSQVLVVHKM